ncbi:unnamed protein product [Caretta caretta]
MDYKVVAKAISLWLGSMLADVVHPDQTYTVPGRSIFDNLYLVWDLLELGCRDGLLFVLLSLDQEKAFNRSISKALCKHLASDSSLWVFSRRLSGLVLREPELRLVLSVYTNDVLLVVQDPGDLPRVEACQAIYSAASSSRSTGSRALAWWSGWLAGELPPTRASGHPSADCCVTELLLSTLSQLPELLVLQFSSRSAAKQTHRTRHKATAILSSKDIFIWKEAPIYYYFFRIKIVDKFGTRKKFPPHCMAWTVVGSFAYSGSTKTGSSGAERLNDLPKAIQEFYGKVGTGQELFFLRDKRRSSSFFNRVTCCKSLSFR